MNILSMKKPVLHLLYEDRTQIYRNSFISQLHKVLGSVYRLKRVSRSALLKRRYSKPQTGERILSILRLRSWDELTAQLAEFCEQGDLFFYDQDPWEGYHDSGVCVGTYRRTWDALRPRCFFVTSAWWAGYIADQDNLPTASVRMGALPENCSLGPTFDKRKYPLGFQGAVHAHRRAFFDRLAAHGHHTEILPYKPFEKFLKSVQEVGIFLYNDNNAIQIDGKRMPLHGLWGKCLTVAARGCFVVRNDDLARQAYGIDELPSVFPFSDETKVTEIVDHILGLTPQEREARRAETVERIRQRNDWLSVSNAIEERVSS